MLLSISAGKLTGPAAFTGGLVGLAVFAGAGYAGILLLVTFFALGVLATAHKRAYKATLQGSGPHLQKRNAAQVLANGGVAALCGLLALADPGRQELYILMMAASLSSATADTLSSELGTVYGRRFYNILNFRKDQQGLDGVVSMEGTLLGIGGSVVIAGIYSLFFKLGINTFLIILAGTAGNLLDSVLGAALERRRYIHNDLVNFLNTLFAALVGGLLWECSKDALGML